MDFFLGKRAQLNSVKKHVICVLTILQCQEEFAINKCWKIVNEQFAQE